MRPKIWTNRNIAIAASRCSTHKEFRENYWSAYIISKRVGIFEQVTSHMKSERSRDKNRETSTELKKLKKMKRSDPGYLSTYCYLWKRNKLPKSGGSGWLVK